MWLTGPVAPWHVGSSQTRARTRVPCIGRQILNHCATREARDSCFILSSEALPRVSALWLTLGTQVSRINHKSRPLYLTLGTLHDPLANPHFQKSLPHHPEQTSYSSAPSLGPPCPLLPLGFAVSSSFLLLCFAIYPNDLILWTKLRPDSSMKPSPVPLSVGISSICETPEHLAFMTLQCKASDEGILALQRGYRLL